ncbi:hypothetical protein [Polymorphum gilvum]|uniref:hypothetical protein n=1 Tax=Polymorphum gilvum TaxID=991904 RepID=UPI0011D1F10F|nr:hypothetical protein [Polymorphum gilvum]
MAKMRPPSNAACGSIVPTSAMMANGAAEGYEHVNEAQNPSVVVLGAIEQKIESDEHQHTDGHV